MKWITINTSWWDFRTTPACAPGVLVEFANGDSFLIGDINRLGGYCGDCSVDDLSIVVRILNLSSAIESAKAGA